MSDTTTEAPKPQPPAQASEQPKPEPKSDDVDWKAEARKWEQRAKENKSAAEKLAEIEEANKSESQKAADRLAKAEKAATEAEARVIRRDIALEHKLTKDDAALLDTITDEGAMRQLAARLAGAESDKQKNSNVVPREGTNPTVQPDPKRAFLRGLAGE